MCSAPHSSSTLVSDTADGPISRFRILCIGEEWLGSDARAVFSAFRRLGHSARVLDESTFVPIQWRSTPARAVRKAFRPILVRELTREATRLIESVKPHMLFVFKGAFVQPELVRGFRERGIPTANYYPDVSFMAHGPLLPATLPLYDRVFTTKSYGIRDLRERLGATNAVFLEHGYDPELHHPIQLTAEERRIYGCDVVYVGSWSPEKEVFLLALRRARPRLHLRIWGCQWANASEELRGCIQGDEVIGDEYPKALCGAKIALGLMSGSRYGASSGDQTTMRSFQIPACGVFMLHPRTAEAESLFADGKEAVFFSTEAEMVALVDQYLSDEAGRKRIAKSGRARAVPAYSVDERARVIVDWLREQRVPAW